jgi:outer membrane receptor protein involved in Fe transport
MKKIFGLMILLFLFTTVNAQELQVKGKITNQHKAPLELVYVSLINTDSTIIKRVLTDSLGQFSIKAKSGVYRLTLEEFGTENSWKISLLQDLDLGGIIVKESLELDGVTITAKKKIIEQKVDRLVFHVENATSATGGTALDALKATPTVRVQNDQISIVGKGEVLVMIDDRLQRMSQEDLANFLKSIPADNIKSIEVITTPPAKYDAEGNNGLINIQLKTARTNSWNATIGSSYTQKTYAGGNLQGLFNYNRNKLSFQLSVNKGRQDLLMNSESQILYENELWKQNMKNKSENKALSFGSGIDYKMTKKWTTGINYLGSFTDRNSVSNPLTTRLNRSTESINSYIASNLNAYSKPEMNSFNWYHSIALDSAGRKITFDLDYFNYRKKDQNSFSGNTLNSEKQITSSTFFSSLNTNINRIQNYSGKADVALPTKWADLSFGMKASYTHTNNDLAVYDDQNGIPVLNTNQSNVFSYEEQNEAVYFSASKKLSEKWEGQMGLRLEATQTKGYSANLDQTNKNNYVKLFPTAYLSYVPNDNNTFSVNYSRRIRRPDFDYLNPFIIRTNPYDYSEGNPFLKPSYFDNLEFSYVKNQKWVNSVYFSHTSDFGQELSIVDANTNITKRTPLNYADIYQIGFSTSYNFNKYSWWNSFTGFNINYQYVKSKTDFVQSIAGYNAYFYSNNDFTLNKSKSIFIGLNYGFQLPGRYQIFEISTMHILDLSAKFLFLDKKLSCAIVVEDVLNGQRPLISYTSNGIKTTVKNYGDTRGFRVSLSYKFGNNKLKSQEKTIGNEDEQGRVK